MSLPEVLLWQALRDRPAHFKFRRQHPSGPYVADFFCHEAQLIIEVDGVAHERGDNPARDAVRDGWFQARGMSVLRIPAREVLDNLDGVIRAIVARCCALTPLRQASLATSPQRGGFGEEFYEAMRL
jgi:very-short-patch-repair endonuclease